MPTIEDRPVVVGVNETVESEVALRWAVAEARLRGGHLHVVAAHGPPDPSRLGRDLISVRGVPAPPRSVSDRFERSMAYARDRLDPDQVSGELVPGFAAPALRRSADTAELLVVGTRGRATRHSVSRAVAAHARCPVVVVRPEAAPQPARIVVGVDGSPEADAALAFAFEEAELRGVTVEVVRCWLPFGPNAGYLAWLESTAEHYREQLSASAQPYSDKYPEVTAIEEVLEGSPVEQLALRSAASALVVVGSRGHGRVVGAMLGSVSQGLLGRARCPVAVVKGRR